MDATLTSPLTVAQAAEALGVSERTVWRYLKSGRLAGTTVGPAGSQRTLIDPDAVAALQGRRSTAPDADALRERLERTAAELARVQAERDQLARRVAGLQQALARPAPPGVVARAATGLAGAVARLRAVRAAA
ncbi:MAG TPA: helix-turn-helix domain-containing protein [Miltoncostaeaceae bacterium]|jgi:excisionase family DNA binding protein|nr:helix-turn-helix domain-containing protein [Miltoncostaeaceae bacterium]